MNAIASLMLLSCFAAADGPKSGALFQTLPDDGAWVTFNVVLKVDGQEVTPTWTVRSVGSVTYDEKPCRFIELEQVCNDPSGMFGNVTWRLLVPEEEFGEGKHPLGKAVKTWVQYEKNAPEAIPSIDARDVILTGLLRGPVTGLKAEDDKEKVAWQRGNLECRAISGLNEIDFAGAKLTMSHRIFQHGDVPFGLAGMRQELKAKFGTLERTASIQSSLADHGTVAKPKLAELFP